jgi:hypothetical protein
VGGAGACVCRQEVQFCDRSVRRLNRWSQVQTHKGSRVLDTGSLFNLNGSEILDVLGTYVANITVAKLQLKS